ncbi:MULTISPECIES: hypothetical protein [Burkholderiaceae]|uniref:Uncharacterized protein n=2 Tax=Burkholderiaceae TaxID=119060 RepID=A0A6J5JGP9_9BURK|nr:MULTISPECIES: hypothetical protein [Burkholderiaceae]ANJ73127.1 hypothetical protein A9Y76_11865 [Ralstonia insidiosa]KAB0601805.1 hypothetical protein F7R19_15000 [Cupriavidus pauculus]MBH9720479.1 hypothetical protein [Burkholderia contaminans]MBR8495129.1 hypothetical protein [Burkholderia cenocepacia]MCO8393873.1 hypothetical protein [Burkholderia cenocepacia]
MESYNEYIKSEDQKKEKEALQKSLSDVLVLWPEPEADLFLTMLSDPMFNEEYKKKLMALVREKGFINNEVMLAHVFSSFIGFKTVAQATEAGYVARDILLNSVPGVVNKQLADFENKIIDMVGHGVAEAQESLESLSEASSKLNQGMIDMKSYVSDGVKIIETAYKERKIDINNAVETKTTEAKALLDKKLVDIEHVLTEKAVKEFRRSIASSIAKAVGWKGLAKISGAVLLAMFAHDLILKVFSLMH